MEDESSSNSEKDNLLGRIFFKKYQCIKKLGEGSFGKIYEAVYKNEHFALKFENLNSNSNLLESEATIMNYLKGPNIPFVKSFGTSGNYNILIMQLMGKSLEDYINEKKTFSIKTVCLLGYQMINILEFIHNKHIVHRDIKPDNFVMGLDSLSKNLYLLDFGLAKKYRSSQTLIHYQLVNRKKLTGTARYASINALRGFEQSRRDDLEAVGYVLMYFLRGSLPWQGLPGKNKDDRYKKILQKKIDTSSYDLCFGFPEEFEEYIDYTRKMEYVEQPLYDKLRGYFLKVLEKGKEDFDYIYDWSTEEEKILRRKEFFEEKNTKKSNKISYSGEEIYLSTKNGIETKGHNSEINEEEEKGNNNDNNIDKYLDEDKIYRSKSKDIKANYKFATKESSLDGNIVNNYKHFNSNNMINGRRNHHHRSSSHTRKHHSKEKGREREKENHMKNENEEVCCSEACNIY